MHFLLSSVLCGRGTDARRRRHDADSALIRGTSGKAAAQIENVRIITLRAINYNSTGRRTSYVLYRKSVLCLGASDAAEPFEPACQLASQRVCQLVSHRATRGTHSIEHSPKSRPGKQQARQRDNTAQPASQPGNQPTSKPSSQSANQPACLA